MREIWKDIPNYEGLYQVSNLGRVKSLNRKVVDKNGVVNNYKGKILNPSNNKSGRPSLRLCKETKQKRYMVSFLVALTFIGPRPDNYDVCHKNGNNQDNRLENLYFDTRSQNTIDHYRYGSKNPSGKLSVDEVLEIRRLYNTGKYSLREIAKVYNIGKSQVARIGKLQSYSYIKEDGTIQESDTKIS